jgi:hypothetical protein
VLRFITRDNSSSINSNYLLEVMLNKGINLNVLYNYVLERVTYITCLFIVNILYNKEGQGYEKGAIRYALL